MSDTTDSILAVANAQQQASIPHIPTPTGTASAAWMLGEHADEWATIREEILAHMMMNPRGLQKTIGPSELGTTCLHCLARKLTGLAKPEGDTAWLPFIGTAVHARFEHMFQDSDRYLPEYKVTVSTLQGTGTDPTATQTITGSIDLYDTRTGATIDWKIVGDSTLDDVRRHGPSQQYRIQASLYGLGLLRSTKYEVKRSCIYFLPRNKTDMDMGYAYETQFDAYPGLWALNRAQTILSLYNDIKLRYGHDTADLWANALPRDPQHCFKCRKAITNPAATDLPSLIGTADDWQAQQEQLADRLPAMPKALLKVPQAQYQPQPINTTTDDKENQS